MDKSAILKDDTVCRINYKNKIDGITLLKNIKSESIATTFFDPQYRGILDKLKYGNEGISRGRSRCELQQMNETTIKQFINEINRTTKPSGHLFLWVDKYHLCTGVLDWFIGTDFKLVDMITWDKGKIGMGYRTRRKSEYFIIFQKEPIRVKGIWNLHNIPDVWDEKAEKVHPHSKPIELQKQLILSTSCETDYICDPASGGYSVYEACKATGRAFIGGDIEYGED